MLQICLLTFFCSPNEQSFCVGADTCVLAYRHLAVKPERNLYGEQRTNGWKEGEMNDKVSDKECKAASDYGTDVFSVQSGDGC